MTRIRRVVPVFLAVVLAAMPAAAAELRMIAPPPGLAGDSVGTFVTALSAATRGAVDITPATGGADASAVLAALAAGNAEVGVLPLAALEQRDPVLAMDRVPYLSSNFVDAGKLWKVLRARVQESLAERGLTLLYAVVSPPAAPLSNRPLTSLADWRGARLQTSRPAMRALARIVGAQAVPGSSPREALAGGEVDITFMTADAATGDKAWEYAAHYLHAPAWFPKQLVVARHDAVAGLGGEARAALLATALEAEARAWLHAEQLTADGVQKLRDYAVQTGEPPVGLLIRLEALGRELLFLWSETAGEEGALLVEDYYAIR